MKLLIFSDIHRDQAALERLMAIEADYYFAAGDLANFGQGLDAMGRILQKRAERMYVFPGNHESEADIAGLCRDFGLHDLWNRGHEKNAVYRKAYPRQVVQPARCGLAGKASTGRFSRQQAWFQGLPSGIQSVTPFPIWEWIDGAPCPPRAALPAGEGEQRRGCHPVLTGLGCC